MRQLLIERAQLAAKVEAILAKAQSEKRGLTATENTESELLLSNMGAINSQINERLAIQAGAIPVPDDFASMIPSNATPAGKRAPFFQRVRQAFQWPGLVDFIKDPTSGVRASLTDGGDLQHTLPGHEVARFQAAFPGNDPHAEAGASITQLDTGWVDGVQPIVTAGAAPSIYTEGTGPSSDQSALVYALELKTPKKIAFLSLPSEEAVADVTSLASTIGAEGIARLLQGRTKRATDTLVADLTSAAALVAGDLDEFGGNYKAILDTIGAIAPEQASNDMVFQMSRKTRSRLLNTRATGTDAPIFSPDMRQILGYRVVINDYVPDQNVIFGNWAKGLFLRSSAPSVQRMEEAYKEDGAVGFRFIMRSDWGTYASVANASQSSQPLVLLQPIDFGS
ncbi:MAG: phage major capsid protein [Terriglobales bacterium]